MNVVTKDGADVNGLEASVTAAIDTVRTALLYGTKLSGLDILGGSATFLSSQGNQTIHYDGVHGDAAHNFDINNNDDDALPRFS